MRDQEDLKKSAYEESDIIEDNDDLTFVKANGYDSVLYFGPKFVKDNYYKKFDKYELYFIIDKKLNPTDKNFCITISKQSHDYGESISIVDKENDDIEYADDYIKERFPSIYEEYLKLFTYTIYNILKRIREGKYDKDSADIGDYDSLIYKMYYDPSRPGASQIILRFDDEKDFFKVFTDNDDEVWFLDISSRGVSNYEYDSWDNSEYEWKDGYMLRYSFNDENQKRVIEIASKTIGYVNKKLEDLDNDSEDISRQLYKLFDNQISDIISEYSSLLNECKNETMKSDIRKEFCNPFANYGIMQYGKYCFYTYTTSPKILMTLFEIYDVRHKSIYELLKTIEKESLKKDPNYYEYAYETGCDEGYSEFMESFNKYVSDRLGDIEEIIDNDENYSNEEHQKFTRNVFSKYNFDQWNSLPYDPKSTDRKFRIVKYRPEDRKIVINYTPGQYKPMETRIYDYESFMNFLHNPELFG